MSEEETKTLPPVREDIIRDISRALAERRKQRGLSLEKVTQNLKIRIQYLQAMEAGNWDQLPGEVYLRGFLKRYMQFLGMDQQILNPYFSLSNGVETQEGKIKALPKAIDPTRTKIFWVAVTVLFLIGLIRVIRQEQPKSLRRADMPLAAATPEAVAPTPVETPAKLISLDPHLLEVHSPYPLWLRVSTPERNFEGFIPQSSTWTWKGQGRFTVRLGHTNQVTLLFDGKSIPLSETQKSLELPSEN